MDFDSVFTHNVILVFNYIIMAYISSNDITGVILAGGRSTRMGGLDKGLVELAGRPMVEYVHDALGPQVGSILISANRNREQYSGYGHPVIGDTVGDYFGPLAGIASAMRVASSKYILTAPCDSPLLPPDLAQRLSRALQGEHAEISVAHDGGRMQPIFALMQRRLLGNLLAFLAGGNRKLRLWVAEQNPTLADFSHRPEAFLNVNTPEDQAALEKKLAQGQC